MADTKKFGIGELGTRAGCKVQTIRYYEEIGVMPEPVRTSGNQRRYGDSDLSRLRFVRHARALGFEIAAIRELLQLAGEPDQSCEAVDVLARKTLVDVEQRRRQLKALGAELTRMIDQCRGGKVAQCRIIEVLADHRLCEDEHAPPGRAVR